MVSWCRCGELCASAMRTASVPASRSERHRAPQGKVDSHQKVSTVPTRKGF